MYEWAKPGAKAVLNGKVFTIRSTCREYQSGELLLRLKEIDNSFRNPGGEEPGYPASSFKPYIHPALLYALNNPNMRIISLRDDKYDRSARGMVK